MKVVDSFAMRVVLWAIPVPTIGIFLLGLLTPVGVALSVLYGFSLLLTFLSPPARDPHLLLHHCDSADLDRLVSQTVWVSDPAWRVQSYVEDACTVGHRAGLDPLQACAGRTQQC
jgi:hypothetical protein